MIGSRGERRRNAADVLIGMIANINSPVGKQGRMIDVVEKAETTLHFYGD